MTDQEMKCEIEEIIINYFLTKSLTDELSQHIRDSIILRIGEWKVDEEADLPAFLKEIKKDPTVLDELISLGQAIFTSKKPPFLEEIPEYVN